jgi:hypothetical protein
MVSCDYRPLPTGARPRVFSGLQPVVLTGSARPKLLCLKLYVASVVIRVFMRFPSPKFWSKWPNKQPLAPGGMATSKTGQAVTKSLGLGEMAQPLVPLIRLALGVGEHCEKDGRPRYRPGRAECGHPGPGQRNPLRGYRADARRVFPFLGEGLRVYREVRRFRLFLYSQWLGGAALWPRRSM